MITPIYENVVVYRRDPGDYVEGTWTPGKETTHIIKAHIQPASPWVTQALPEGRRDNAAILIISKSRLIGSQEGKNISPDQIEWAGRRWEVYSVEEFSYNLPEAHFEAVAVLVDDR